MGRALFEAAIAWGPMLAALVAAGAVGGLLAGLLGVGGGIIIVPALDLALTMAGVDPSAALHVAVGTSMATIVPTSISSSRSHARRGSIDFEVVRRWSLPTVLGALTGSLVAAVVDARVLAAVFGTVAGLAALKMALPLDHVVLRKELPRGLAGASLPAGIGAVSAMMGIGGGTLSVPAMTLCGEPVHKAVGTAALIGLWISLPATTGYLLAHPSGEVMPPWTVGSVSLPGFAIIAPAAWAMAPLGARLAHALDRRRLSAAFGVFLLLVAARMLYRALA
jgi:uncharacterized membrane protein YfcA